MGFYINKSVNQAIFLPKKQSLIIRVYRYKCLFYERIEYIKKLYNIQ